MKLINISIKYPFVEHLLSNLRDAKLQKKQRDFKNNVHTLGQILAIELSCHLNYTDKKVVTPFDTACCKQLNCWPTIVPILRAGRALQEGIKSILTNSSVVDCVCPKYINSQRYAEININEINPDKPCVICDPIIASGKSIISVINSIKGHCSSIYILSCITTNYALSAIKKSFTDGIVILTCAMDDFTPNIRGTRPGLGDVGDLLYGSKTFKLKISPLYKGLSKDAEYIPQNANVKMIFRHSYRDPFVKEKDYQTMPLNEYGIRKAQDLGKSIEYHIGEMYSSELQRCIQTLKYMTNSDRITIAADYLTSVFTYDNKLADEQIELLGSLKKVIIELKTEETLPGFYPINETVKRMIDFVFSTGNRDHSIDLYCTHDFHIGMMLAVMYDDINTIETLSANWPNMLEGMLLFGTRKSFYCLWRGQKKYFYNYLI